MKGLEKALQIIGASEDKIDKIVSSYGQTRTTAHNTMSCPRCGGLMTAIELADGSRAKYCIKHRIATPMV